MRGELIGNVQLYFQDSAGAIMKDFGQISQSTFIFTAMKEDKYSLVMKNNGTANVTYKLTYTVYNRQ